MCLRGLSELLEQTVTQANVSSLAEATVQLVLFLVHEPVGVGYVRNDTTGQHTGTYFKALIFTPLA